MVTDPTILSEYFLLDASNENYKEMIVMQCPISAVMSEIIIIQADDVDAAAEDLKARQQKAIDQDAWYPDDIDMANNSIVGTCGDYAYSAPRLRPLKRSSTTTLQTTADKQALLRTEMSAVFLLQLRDLVYDNAKYPARKLSYEINVLNGVFVCFIV